MNVTPYQLLKRSSAQALSGRAAAALAHWGAAWAALPDHAVSCAAASDAALAPGALRCRRLADGTSVWVSVAPAIERHLEQLIFGLGEMDATSERHTGSALGTGVAAAALEDLLLQLVEALSGQASHEDGQATPPPRLLQRGSGAVVCTVLLGERSVRLLLPPAALPAAPAVERRVQSAPLATLHQALAHVPVTLSVEVSRPELTLGYLRTLAVGDVLALPTGVDAALRLTGPDDTTVCHAHLGALDGKRAVELIKPVRSAGASH